jgi:hypothetical protein
LDKVELVERRWRGKRLEAKLTASLRDLTSGSKWLPWTEVIFLAVATLDQTFVVVGGGVVFSKAVNGRSGRPIRKHVIAVKVASKRRGVGGVGSPANGIGPARTGRNVGVSRVGVIGSGGRPQRGQRCQLACPRCARASAQLQKALNFTGGVVNGRAAIRSSRSGTSIPRNVFAAWLAAWLYVACWIAKRVIGNGVGVGDGNKGRDIVRLQTRREHVFASSSG